MSHENFSSPEKQSLPGMHASARRRCDSFCRGSSAGTLTGKNGRKSLQSLLFFWTVNLVLFSGAQAFLVHKLTGVSAFQRVRVLSSKPYEYGGLGRRISQASAFQKSARSSFATKYSNVFMSLQDQGDLSHEVHTATSTKKHESAMDASILSIEREVAKLEAELVVKKAQLQRARQRAQRSSHASHERSSSPYNRSAERQPQLVQALMELEDLINVVDALGSSPSTGGCPWTWSQVIMT
jgi:hypothetical protein